MKNKKETRFWIIAVIVIIMFLIMAGKLVKIQVVEGENYFRESIVTNETTHTIIASRGNIYDRNGMPIARNRLGFYIQYVDTGISDEEKNSMFLRLYELFEENGDVYRSRITNYIDINPIRFKTENLSRFISNVKIKDKNTEESIFEDPYKTFQYLREKTFLIDSSFSDEEAFKIMQFRYEILNSSFTLYKPLMLAADVNYKTIAVIEESHDKYPGLSVITGPVRVYNNAYPIAHVLGYMREIDKAKLDQWKIEYPDDNYKPGDWVGRSGVEVFAEHYLRGHDGKRTIEVDLEGEFTALIEETPAIPGDDIYLTIDLNIQKVAMQAMEDTIEEIKQKGGKGNFGDANAGAVVAIDVKTGEILAMASYPSYDPQVYLDNNSKAIIEIFSDSINTPAFHRAIGGKYAPGSTYKPLIAIAGLEEGVIDAHTHYLCSGTMEIGDRDFKCAEGVQGRIALVEALATSCNLYFNQLGVDIKIDNIVKWTKAFGLGIFTELDLYGEESGIISSREYKWQTKQEKWWVADTAQSSIGQLYNEFTPLQLSSYVSAIAGGGVKYKPHVILARKPYGEEIIWTEIKKEIIPVKEETIELVQDGMIAVANAEDGTAVEEFRDFPFQVAGKTGTAETGKEDKASSNALFVCYAPADNPQIAVAVVIEHGVWGAYTAPVAREIIREYFRIENNKNDIIQKPPNNMIIN